MTKFKSPQSFCLRTVKKSIIKFSFLEIHSALSRTITSFNFKKCTEASLITNLGFIIIDSFLDRIMGITWNRPIDTSEPSYTSPKVENKFAISFLCFLKILVECFQFNSMLHLKVSKSQNLFFLKLHCPQNERNIGIMERT